MDNESGNQQLQSKPTAAVTDEEYESYFDINEE